MAKHSYAKTGFSEKLSAIMADRNLSQEGLAERCEVSQTLVGNWKRGVNVPSLEKAVGLARVLGVSMDYLYDGSISMMSEMELRTAQSIRDVVSQIGVERAWRRLIEGKNEIEAPPSFRHEEQLGSVGQRIDPKTGRPLTPPTTKRKRGSA